tara:strand:+ start:73 stop:999 length:927 start_codon:yes stop_codon:yes gene_type:complete
MKKLFCKLLLAASFLTPLFTNKVQAMGSGPFEGLKDFAKSVTLGIETPASSGSGILIGKKGDTYFFLTAGHVAISDPQKEEFWAYSVAGGQTKQYQITSFEKPKAFEGKDIVIGSFTTKDQLQIALIFPLDIEKYVPAPPSLPFPTWQGLGSMNGKIFDYEWDIQGPPLIGGVSIPTRAITIPIFRFSTGVMQMRAPGNQQGYEAIYSATSTLPGMSGGGIYGARVCPDGKFDPDSNRISWGAYPGVIGMHGMSEEYGSSGGRSGTSLGVPLDLFVEYFGKNADRYGIPTGKDYLDEVIKLCVTQSMY